RRPVGAVRADAADHLAVRGLRLAGQRARAAQRAGARGADAGDRQHLLAGLHGQPAQEGRRAAEAAGRGGGGAAVPRGQGPGALRLRADLLRRGDEGRQLRHEGGGAEDRPVEAEPLPPAQEERAAVEGPQERRRARQVGTLSGIRAPLDFQRRGRMSNRIAVVLASALAFAAALALACATPKPETTSEPVVKMVTSTVTNQTWFDLANCFGQAPSVPPRASDGVVVGLLQSANPQIMECMTDPRNRGPKERTVITVSTKVPETGVPEHTITSDNITPEGEACIRGVLAKVMPTFTQKAADVLMLPKGDKNKKMEVVDVGKDKGKAKGKGKGKGKGKEEKDTGPVTVGGGDEVKIDEDEMHALKDLPPGTAAALVKFVHDVKV